LVLNLSKKVKNCEYLGKMKNLFLKSNQKF
jgi:hypothetical protein